MPKWQDECPRKPVAPSSFFASHKLFWLSYSHMGFREILSILNNSPEPVPHLRNSENIQNIQENPPRVKKNRLSLLSSIMLPVCLVSRNSIRCERHFPASSSEGSFATRWHTIQNPGGRQSMNSRQEDGKCAAQKLIGTFQNQSNIDLYAV